MTYSIARSTPLAVIVLPLTTRSMVAPGAMLVARETSSVASDWKLDALPLIGGAVAAGPGSTPFGGITTVGVFEATPESDSKFMMS